MIAPVLSRDLFAEDGVDKVFEGNEAGKPDGMMELDGISEKTVVVTGTL